MAESLFDWQSYVNRGIIEMATKLKSGASTATVLEMASKRHELYQWTFPVRKQHKWLLCPAILKQNDGGECPKQKE